MPETDKILLTEHFKEMELIRKRFDDEKILMSEKIKTLTQQCDKINIKMDEKENLRRTLPTDPPTLFPKDKYYDTENINKSRPLEYVEVKTIEP